jgi:hypothetical protein
MAHCEYPDDKSFIPMFTEHTSVLYLRHLEYFSNLKRLLFEIHQSEHQLIIWLSVLFSKMSCLFLDRFSCHDRLNKLIGANVYCFSIHVSIN